LYININIGTVGDKYKAWELQIGIE
jgi:hypothetical protein